MVVRDSSGRFVRLLTKTDVTTGRATPWEQNGPPKEWKMGYLERALLDDLRGLMKAIVR